MENEQKRAQLYGLLGDLPPLDYDISAFVYEKTDCGSYMLEKIKLDFDGADQVYAYFEIPKNVRAPFPVVLYSHCHGGLFALGKDELIKSCDFLSGRPYAEVFAEMGIGAFCIDARGFGERRGYDIELMAQKLIIKGSTFWGQLIFDDRMAFRYLLTRDDVDKSRIAAMGLSMGGIESWWLSALEPDICCCIETCGLVDYGSVVEDSATRSFGVYHTVPRLLKYFSTSDIYELTAPRPHIALNGDKDVNVPGALKVNARMTEVYSRMGVPDNWEFFLGNSSHYETSYMRYRIIRFLRKHMAPGPSGADRAGS
jgi:dienelactone hydrolase